MHVLDSGKILVPGLWDRDSKLAISDVLKGISHLDKHVNFIVWTGGGSSYKQFLTCKNWGK